MGLTITRSNASNGRSAPGFNYYTGGMFYGTAPSGWTSYTHPLYPSVSIKARQILSASDAITQGINPNTDNTANTYTSLCTIGDVGDEILVQATIPVIGGGTSLVDLCDYTLASGDTTLALQGASIAAAINANTYLTGFSASFTTATLTLIAPKSLGIYFNTGTPYTFTVTPIGTPVNTFAFGTQTLGVSGTASVFADAYYQISEYYRINPTGNLWIGFISASSSFQEILALQLASGNQLRQMWIADTDVTRGAVANLLATTQSIQSIVNNITNTTPIEVVYRPNIAVLTSSTLSTLPNGQLNTATNNVQVIITQDGSANGALLFLESGYSISNVGAKLGTLSASRLSASDAQPIPINNVSDGIENNVAALSNGTLISALSISLFQQLFGTTSSNTSGYAYIGFIQYPGNVSGTFWTGNTMFITNASRYAFMNDNRVWDAITRILQTTYIPQINSEIQYNNDGTINSSSIGYLQNLGVNAITAGMISGYNPPLISGTPIVSISADQDVQATNTLNIGVGTLENGIVRNIAITNGFLN